MFTFGDGDGSSTSLILKTDIKYYCFMKVTLRKYGNGSHLTVDDYFKQDYSLKGTLMIYIIRG